MAKRYCDVLDVENYTLKEIVDSFEDQVLAWIEAVTAMMDTLADRSLVAPVIGSGEDYEFMYYDGNDRDYLDIDDCQEIVNLSIGDYWGANEAEIAETEYVTNPRKTPYKRIYLKNGIFTEGQQNIVVEGRFGLFNTTPADIKLACTIIVAGIVNAQNPSNAGKKSESIGNYSVTYMDDKGIADYKNALQIVNSYRRISI